MPPTASPTVHRNDGTTADSLQTESSASVKVQPAFLLEAESASQL
jgi:hypothetical protein